jgi:hypothetical protein
MKVLIAANDPITRSMMGALWPKWRNKVEVAGERTEVWHALRRLEGAK